MIASLSPPAYASALSKKLHPASCAACMHSSASVSSSWVSNVTQLPNDSTLTLMPARPSRRYSMLDFFCVLVPGMAPRIRRYRRALRLPKSSMPSPRTALM